MIARGSIDEWYQFAENMKQHSMQQKSTGKKKEKAFSAEKNRAGNVSASNTSTGNGKESERYEQLTLPGIELTEKTASATRIRASVYDFAPEDYRIDILKSEKSAIDLMSRLLADSRLSDLCRHCAADSNSWMGNVSKKEKARLILAKFQQYPECLQYIFTWDEYAWIRRNLIAPGSDIPLPEDPMTIALLQSLGLIEYQFWAENGTEIAEITVPADVETIFRNVKAKQLKRTYACIQSNADRLLDLMTLYGVIEIDELFAGYSEQFEFFETSSDFRRFVYLYAMYNDLVHTGQDIHGKDFMIHGNLNLHKAMAQFVRHPEIPYKLFSDDDIDQIAIGICHYNTAWDLYFTELTYSRFRIEMGKEAAEKRAAECCDETLKLIQEGRPLTEIMETCRKNQEFPKSDSIEDEVELWDKAIRLSMETPLPLFHGYTRSEALDALRMSPDALFLLPDTKRPKMEKTTHIADMDPELQIELYDMCSIDEDFSGRYDEILKEIGCANYELRFMKIHELIMAGDYDRAETETKQLLKESGDPRLEDQLEYIYNYREIAEDAEDFEEELFSFPSEDRYGIAFDEDEDLEDDFWSQPSIPYRREQPKIGRNDPCPCGSGKKYKHCCGK